MKKQLIYILAVGMFSLASCESELEQNPFNALSSTQAFNTPADFENAVRGAYAGLRGGSYYGGQDGGSMIITPDIISDNLIINSQGRFSQQTTYQLNYTANATWNIWNNAYTTILRTNYVLENIDKLEEGTVKGNLKAEALAIRALAHFDLLRVYGKRYMGAADTDLGVPYVKSTDPSQKPARLPLKESYNLVVADFLEAETAINASNGVGRLNKAAVQGLLGRVYLYMGQWQNAADKSSAAITNAPTANALATRAEFPSVWTDATEKDVLFKVKILDPDAVTVGVGYQQTVTGNVRAEYSPTCELVQQYQTSDVRTSTYIGQSTYSGLTAKYVKKHVGRATGALNVVDVKVLRLSEVYLNRAEALYNLGGPANQLSALADLNQIRSKRYSDYNAATAIEAGQDLYNAILKERRLELAFEGHRFFDLKRLGMGIVRSATQGDAADCSGVVAPATARLLAADNFRFQLPIPQAEITANKNIVQNPGY